MIKTLSELRAELGRITNRTDYDTVRKSLFNDLINRRYQEILRAHPWGELVQRTETTLSGGKSEHGLSANIDKILKLYDRTNDIVLQPVDAQTLVDFYVESIDGQGTPRKYANLGTLGVHTQPANFSVSLQVQSSATDTGTVRLVGEDTDKLRREFTAKLSGTGEVTIVEGLTNQIEKVISLSKDQNTAGVVTLKQGSTTLGKIAPLDRAARYPWIKLDAVLSDDATYQIVHTIRCPALIEDQDVPVLDCDHVLLLGAEASWWRNERQFSKSSSVEARYGQALGQYIMNKVGADSSIQFRPATEEVRRIWF